MEKKPDTYKLNTVLNHPEELRVAGRPIDETFFKTVRRMWVQFAKRGNPSLAAEQSPDGHTKEWPRYDAENKYMMVLDESASTRSGRPTASSWTGSGPTS